MKNIKIITTTNKKVPESIDECQNINCEDCAYYDKDKIIDTVKCKHYIVLAALCEALP